MYSTARFLMSQSSTGTMILFHITLCILTSFDCKFASIVVVIILSVCMFIGRPYTMASWHHRYCGEAPSDNVLDAYLRSAKLWDNCLGRLNEMRNVRIDGVAFSLFSFCILLLLLLTKWNLFLTVFSVYISNARGMHKTFVSLSSLSQVIHSGGKDVTNLSFFSLLFFHNFSLVPPSFAKKPENGLEEL